MKHAQSLVAAAATLFAPGALAAAMSGDFSILAMNVAGLPAILNDNGVPGDKETNAATIGSKFAQYNYDVIQVQEDFNYHAHIYRTDTHTYRTATSGGVPIGSGLNTLSNFEFVDFRRIKWNKCSDITAADCLTPKGFTFMRVALTPSTHDSDTAVYADFYNVHSDAGQTDIDFWARQDNINQVASYISTWSAGNAVLVFGDVNSRYSKEGDTAIRSLLAISNPSGPGLTDPWVEHQYNNVIPSAAPSCGNPAADNACEIVDKVFYRSSPLLTLTAESFTYASHLFLQDDGVSILTDHNPVQVNFTWSVSDTGSSLKQSPFFGGAGEGTWFSDVPRLAALYSSPTAHTKPTTITFRGGDRVDSVGLTLVTGGSTVTTLLHGGSGGTSRFLSLESDEYWTAAELCQGQRKEKTRIFYIKALTSKGRSLEAGVRTDECVTYTAPGCGAGDAAGEEWQIVGFLGQDGDEMDQLGFVYGPR